jgi:hypothetical protein
LLSQSSLITHSFESRPGEPTANRDLFGKTSGFWKTPRDLFEKNKPLLKTAPCHLRKNKAFFNSDPENSAMSTIARQLTDAPIVQLLARLAILGCLVCAPCVCGAVEPQPPATVPDDDLGNARRPASDDELRRWLNNMVRHHRYSLDECRLATGLELPAIRAALERFHIDADSPPTDTVRDTLMLLPYPGGRHPRIGFRDGAIRPQRETKASAFAPWDQASYVVLDVPEAIFSNLGLLYLAHTHVPTIWDQQQVELPPLEWREESRGVLTIERTLPNKVAFGTRLTPHADSIAIDMWLTNGTPDRLTGLRVQNCVMLRGMPEFASQTNDNKFYWRDYAACRNEAGTRWVIAACMPHGKSWGNAKCPCLHADPQFPDCDSGQTVRTRGWLSFYEGTDIQQELERIEATGWREPLDPNGEVLEDAASSTTPPAP